MTLHPRGGPLVALMRGSHFLRGEKKTKECAARRRECPTVEKCARR